MQDTEIFVKTDAGRDEIRSRTLGLPMSVRAILLMIDGQRSVSAMRALIAGSKAPTTVLEDLVTQGLIEPRDAIFPTPDVAATPAAPPPTPAVRPPAPIAAAAPLQRTDEAATPSPSPSPLLPPAVATVPPALDLELPTIFGPEADAMPIVAGDAAGAATPAENTYEHLYAMMNEIVRDFLAPHRRYFFQLKIERCGTADELLELLNGLHIALAKSRGDAFAADVIARLRSAAV